MLGKCLFCGQSFKKGYKQQIFCSLTCSNRYNLNNLNTVSLPKRSRDLAEFVGIMLGDGYVGKYFSRVSLNSIADRGYVNYVASLSAKLFGDHVVTIIPEKKMNMINVQISSRIVSDFLKNLGLIPNNKKIPDWISKNRFYSKACIKGLVDTEGSISFKQYHTKKGVSVYKQLNFRNADINLIKFVRDFLVTLGLKPTQTLKRSLYLSTHNAIAYYRKVIGFGNKKLLQRSHVTDLQSYNLWRGDRAG